MNGALPATRVRFEGVGVDFPTASGPMRVIDGVDLQIAQGEFVSIIGPSGCGRCAAISSSAYAWPRGACRRLSARRSCSAIWP